MLQWFAMHRNGASRNRQPFILLIKKTCHRTAITTLNGGANHTQCEDIGDVKGGGRKGDCGGDEVDADVGSGGGGGEHGAGDS